ncbi:MAG TPA: hypothetical protein VFX15_03730 [Actinomycetes bacterium]|nr:hypothetical protein [Actinomycetes bacterium]
MAVLWIDETGARIVELAGDAERHLKEVGKAVAFRLRCGDDLRVGVAMRLA